MVVASGQFTIRDENDITVGVSGPTSPVIDQMWLDTSVKPSIMKRWTGTTWEIVGDIEIGGRNLWTTSNLVSGYTSTTVASLGSIVIGSNVHKIVNSLIPTNGNKYVTIQIWNPNLANNTSNTNRLAFFDNSDVFISQTTTIRPNGTKYQYQMIPIPNNTSTMRIGMICGATIYDSSINIKVEFGNKATDWTPAPEDIDTDIRNVKTITETNTTSINTIQGQISTLISNTTIIKDGTTTQLKDAYNGTVQTINSINTTLGEHTSTLNTLNGTISSNSSKITSLQANLDTVSATLSSTKSTVDTHTTQISTANSNITTALNNASSAVTTANTAKTTATTASTDASTAKSTANTANTNASTALTNSNNAISTANTAGTNASSALSTANKASTDVATLTTTVTNTTSRVASLELTTSGLSTRIGATETTLSNLSIGGRNLLIGTSKELKSVTLSGWGDWTATGTNSNRLSIEKVQLYTARIYLKASTQNVRILCRTFKDNSYTEYYDYWGNIIDANSEGYSTVTFTTKQDVSTLSVFAIRFNSSSTPSNIVQYKELKLEKGNQATDWTPAPEDIDNSIATVKDYATTTINSAVSTINQTTDSIKANVSSLQSSVSTINTTLGNKADATTVTAISNRTASLETSLTGINASITTLNSNVSSVTTTANSAKTAIDSLQVGGRNLISKSSNLIVGYLQNNGNMVTTDTNWYTTDFISVKEFKQYIASGYNNLGNSPSTCFYNSSKVFVSGINNGNSVSQATEETMKNDRRRLVTIPTGCVYMKFSFEKKDLNVIKLEMGNTPTDWTPAPEDTDSQITTINSSVSSLQSSVSVLQNQIALKVEQSDINSAISTVDGKIENANTTISSLQSQINLQAGLISSKVEQTTFNSTIADITSNNLLLNSTGNLGIVKWMSGIVSEIKYNYQSLKISNSATSEKKYGSDRIILKPNTTYTISFYITGDSNLISADMFLLCRRIGSVADWDYAPTKSGIVPSTTGFTYVTWQYTTTADVQDGYIRLDNNGTKTSGTESNVWFSRIKVEEGMKATAWSPALGDSVGTIITQSTTEVMTAFNNISSYFQVSADGAKFGNIASGDYTTMSSSGLLHHVGATNYEYVYLAYTQQISVILPNGTSDAEFTFAYDSTLLTLLNGRVPKSIVPVDIISGSSYVGSAYSLTGTDNRAWCTNKTANNFTIKCYKSNKAIKYQYTINTSGSSDTLFLDVKTFYGGDLLVKLLILA